MSLFEDLLHAADGDAIGLDALLCECKWGLLADLFTTTSRIERPCYLAWNSRDRTLQLLEWSIGATPTNGPHV